MGIDMLIGVRGLAEDMVRGAETQQLRATHFANDSDAAGEFLAAEIGAGDVVLVKGSRGVRTEKVIERLLSEFQLEGNEL